MLKSADNVESGGAVNNRLSYSQSRLFSECGQKYRYYYKDRLREKTKSAALCFGSAFDTATGIPLAHFKKTGNWDCDEYAAFDEAWQKIEVNGKVYDAPTCTLIGYAASDFDYEILTSDDHKFLTAKIEELCPGKFTGKDLETIRGELAEFKSLNDNKSRPWGVGENELHNLYNWLSMRRKGHLMLNANRKYILPKIKEVLGVQKLCTLTNDKGDSVIGYLDLECIWEDGRHIILDYKTSARDYDSDAVLFSPQLSIYTYTHDVPYGGFLVFKKTIRKNRIKVCSVCSFNGSGGRHKTCSNEIEGKRCGGEWIEKINPECDVDVLINAIPARTQEIVIENLNVINTSITNENYTRNFNSCKTGYGRCPYFNLCYKNDDSDLEKV